MLLEATPQNFYQVTGAQNGVTYDFRLRATDNVGNSDEWPNDPQASTTISTFATATVLPFNPAILKPTAPVTTSFTVNWTGTAAVGVPITGYQIYFQFNGEAWQQWGDFPGSQTSGQFPLQQLRLGDGFYGFEAIAINSAGQREPQRFVAEASIIVDLANQVQPRDLPLMLDQANSLVATSATAEVTDEAESTAPQTTEGAPQEVELINLAP